MSYRFRTPDGQDRFRASEGEGETADDAVKNIDVVEVNLAGQRVAANRPFPVADGGMGTDGANAPAIPGTGVRGWLRALYEAFIARIPASISGRLPVNAEGTVNVGNLPATQNVAGTVTANLGTLNGAATNATVQAAVDSLGTDGAGAPSIVGTGVRGWLRAILEAILARLPLTGGGKLDTRPLASGTDSVTVAGTVTANFGSTGALATTGNVQAVTDSLGTDGSSPPAIAGTGVRGWLRAIYEALLGALRVRGKVVRMKDRPTLSHATEYTAGDLLGTVKFHENVVESEGAGLLLSSVSARGVFNISFTLMVFDADPIDTKATAADNQPFNVHYNDQDKVVAALHFDGLRFRQLDASSGNSFVMLFNREKSTDLPEVVIPASGRGLWTAAQINQVQDFNGAADFDWFIGAVRE